MRVRGLAHGVMRWIRGEDESRADGLREENADEFVNAS